MSLLSVPLTPDLEKVIKQMINDGVASNKAELARKAIEKLAEDHAVQVVLDAEKELALGRGLSGDLDELAKKL